MGGGVGGGGSFKDGCQHNPANQRYPCNTLKKTQTKTLGLPSSCNCCCCELTSCLEMMLFHSYCDKLWFPFSFLIRSSQLTQDYQMWTCHTVKWSLWSRLYATNYSVLLWCQEEQHNFMCDQWRIRISLFWFVPDKKRSITLSMPVNLFSKDMAFVSDVLILLLWGSNRPWVAVWLDYTRPI